MNLKKSLTIMATLLVVFMAGCKKEDLPGARPEVSSTVPLSNAVNIAIGSKITALFSVPMDGASMTAANFTVMIGTSPVAGTVTYIDSTVTFTPTADMTPGSVYTATITTGVKDKAGLSILKNYIWNFTSGAASDVTAPTVLLPDPLNNATLVVRNKIIQVNFSEAMDPLTINANSFSLKQGTTVVTGTVSYTGITAKFTPANVLEANTVYTATVTTGVKDIAGNALSSNLVWSFTTVASSSTLGVVNLGAAGNYVILAKTAITNISTSSITGDLGLSPAATSYITGLALTNATGYATSAQVTGQLFAADMAAPTGINLTTAVENMITAYNDAAGRPTPDFLELGTGNIGGKTLTPGLYKWTTDVTMPSDVTISGGANDVWIFQISQNLLLSNGVHINLIGGAQTKNIFWQVAGQATFGTTSHFEGIVMSMTGITMQTGASFKGRALAQTAVVLDGATVILP